MKCILFTGLLFLSCFLSSAQQNCFDEANKFRHRYMDQTHIDFDSLDHYMKKGEQMIVNCYFPNDTFTTIKGEHLSLEKFKGKIIVIDFWSVHCPPCINEIPSFHALQKKFGKELAVLAFTLDQKIEAERFLQKHKYDVAVIPDAKLFKEKYSLDSPYPFVLLLDKDRKILSVKSGGSIEPERKMDLFNEFYPLIERALKQK